MTVATVLDIGTQALLMVALLAGPLLAAGLFVGLSVGVFQAVTQINEMTLTFIPKIISIMGLLIFLLPWMGGKMIDFTVRLISRIPDLIR
jgi:flagellar biosynthetic protein FliQ